MFKLVKKCWHKFLDIFGDVHISKYPLWLMYDPEYFKMAGKKILEILNNARPGDIILRGYDGYADGYFIPHVEGHGRYSHGGIVVEGGNVVHAISPTVAKTNLIEFMECDRIALFRPKKDQFKAVLKANKFFDDKVNYDFDFQTGSKKLYCFELCAECYDGLDIKPQSVRILGGLIRRKACYVAQSFFDSNDLDLMLEFNPKNNINMSKFE